MTDPIEKFHRWLETAKADPSIAEPTAMCLATASGRGRPSARMVLLKEADARGFVFYTNLESRKGHDLKENPFAALCFHWMQLQKQVRVEGMAEPVSAAEADAYFKTRARESQLGAWSSKQSQPLEGMGALMAAVAANTAKYLGRDVPRPPFWSGWRVVPERIEFWSQGAFRLHERELFTRDGQGWKITRLYP